MSVRECDVIVVGAGPAGEVLAGRVAERGLKTVIAEDRLVGGECAYWACMPSKALLRPAQALDEARRVPGAAQAAAGTLDVPAVLARRDEVIHGLDDEAQMPWLRDRGIGLLRGRAVLDGERTVRVGGEVVRARRAVVLAVGTVPAIPPIPGLAEAEPWTNREATTSGEVPASLVVLGGGPVGCELAQAYASLGSRVALVERADCLLGREEGFAARLLREGLLDAGVAVHDGTEVREVRPHAGSGAPGHVVVTDNGELQAERLLVASGRRQTVGELGLERVGLQADGALEVGDDLRVPGHDWLYVIGDANGRQLLTHMGKHQARLAADRITGHGDVALRDDGPPPRVVFTQPQVASVGYTLFGAREAGLRVRAVDASTQGTAGASFHGKGHGGTSRLVVDEDRRVVVGATFVGPDVAEWLHAATVAVVGRVSLDDLWHAIPAFPTRSEVWLRLLEEYGL